MTISKKTELDHDFELVQIIPKSPRRIMRCKICGGVPSAILAPGIEVAKTLTRHCCGRMLTAEESDAVEEERLDFRDGEWVELDKAASPYS